MFLCKECHKDANCNSLFCDFDLLIALSLGTCERCGKTAPCVDCHQYYFTKPYIKDINTRKQHSQS